MNEILAGNSATYSSCILLEMRKAMTSFITECSGANTWKVNDCLCRCFNIEERKSKNHEDR